MKRYVATIMLLLAFVASGSLAPASAQIFGAPTIPTVQDPLQPDQLIPQFDTRFGGASQYYSQKAYYQRLDAGRLQYWQTCAGNPQPGDRCFKDWQVNAIHDVNDLHLDPSVAGDPPKPPLSHVVAVTEEDGLFGRVYVVHIDNGGPLAQLPNPLIPPDTGLKSTGTIAAQGFFAPAAIPSSISDQLAAQQQQINLLTQLLQALLGKQGAR